MEPFLTRTRVFVWTALLLLVPLLLFSPIAENTSYGETVLRVVLSTILVTIVLLGSAFVLRQLPHERDRSHVLLAVNAAIVVYHLSSVLGIVAGHFFGEGAERVVTFIQPWLVFITGLSLVRWFDMAVDLRPNLLRVWPLLRSIMVGLGFGIVFIVIREPVVVLPYSGIGALILFSAAVGASEELIFRFVLLRSAERGFGRQTAQWLQSIVFAAMHLVSFNYIVGFYSTTPTILAETPIVSVGVYFLALLFFGRVCGWLAGVRQGRGVWGNGNIWYAIVAHWVANLVTLVVAYL